MYFVDTGVNRGRAGATIEESGSNKKDVVRDNRDRARRKWYASFHNFITSGYFFE